MPKHRRPVIAISLTVLILTVAVFTLGIVRKIQLDASSQASAIALTQAALTGNARVLIEHGSDAWLLSMSEDAVVNYSAFVLRTLGSLQSMQRISGTSYVPLFILSREQRTASYTLELEFANSTADAIIELQLQDGDWKVSNFSVLSEFLFE